MSVRRSYRWPILLAVVMIVLLVALTVGWVLINVFGVQTAEGYEPLYWTMLAVGTTLLGLLLAGVVIYLLLAIKAVNLNRRQSNFIDAVTHELKSPIASLKLYLQTLSRRAVSDAERADFCQFMLEDVDRLDHLINHVLDAARLDKDAAEEKAEDVRLDALLKRCAQTVCLAHRIAPDTVRLDLAACVVRARPADLEIVFRNLIDNAIKYSPGTPNVIVSLQSSGDGQVLARISDNGPGIPAKQRRKLFRRFVRLGSELERQKPGTGLGLFIARTLVRRMRGKISLTDRQPPPGSVFEVSLPGRAASPTRSPATDRDSLPVEQT